MAKPSPCPENRSHYRAEVSQPLCNDDCDLRTEPTNSGASAVIQPIRVHQGDSIPC